MKITTLRIIDMETGETIVHEQYDYYGPVDSCCGAGKEMKETYASMRRLATTMQQAYNTAFQGNQKILESITKVLTPIVAAGPGQFGFTPREEAARRAAISQQLSAAGKRATDVTRSALASRGGGMTFLPSGAEAAIEASLAGEQARTEALAQAELTGQGYDIGRQQFLGATQLLSAAPGQLYAPVVSLGESARLGLGGQAEQAQKIQAANRAWMGPVAGLIGGVIGGPIGAALGSKLFPSQK